MTRCTGEYAGLKPGATEAAQRDSFRPFSRNVQGKPGRNLSDQVGIFVRSTVGRDVRPAKASGTQGKRNDRKGPSSQMKRPWGDNRGKEGKPYGTFCKHLSGWGVNQALVWGILAGEKFQTIPTSYQWGLNVFPVSRSVFRRERIRGHPSAQAV